MLYILNLYSGCYESNMCLIKILQRAWSGVTKGKGRLQCPSLGGRVDSQPGQGQWPLISRSDKCHGRHSGQNLLPVGEGRLEMEEEKGGGLPRALPSWTRNHESTSERLLKCDLRLPWWCPSGKVEKSARKGHSNRQTPPASTCDPACSSPVRVSVLWANRQIRRKFGKVLFYIINFLTASSWL